MDFSQNNSTHNTAVAYATHSVAIVLGKFLFHEDYNLWSAPNMSTHRALWGL